MHRSDDKLFEELSVTPYVMIPVTLSDGSSGFKPCPELLTEEELVQYLRIPEITQAKNYHNVIENLKRMHKLPRIHICGRPLYPLHAVREWVKQKVEYDT